jgi:hypothetical protein
MHIDLSLWVYIIVFIKSGASFEKRLVEIQIIRRNEDMMLFLNVALINIFLHTGKVSWSFVLDEFF